MEDLIRCQRCSINDRCEELWNKIIIMEALDKEWRTVFMGIINRCSQPHRYGMTLDKLEEEIELPFKEEG